MDGKCFSEKMIFRQRLKGVMEEPCVYLEGGHSSRGNSKCIGYGTRAFLDSSKRTLLTEKKCESHGLSIILGKIRTIAPETVFQIALRNYSKERAGGRSVYV